MDNIIERLYQQRQSGFSCRLFITAVWFELSGGNLKAIMEFSIPDKADYYGQAKDLPGVEVYIMDKPPASTMALDGKRNPRAIDKQIIDLAWRYGACDMSRYQKPGKIEWLFKPSWHGAHTRKGWRLKDQKVNQDGLRLEGEHRLFPAPLVAEFAPGVDCYQHIYEFCKPGLVKVAS